MYLQREIVFLPCTLLIYWLFCTTGSVFYDDCDPFVLYQMPHLHFVVFLQWKTVHLNGPGLSTCNRSVQLIEKTESENPPNILILQHRLNLAKK